MCVLFHFSRIDIWWSSGETINQGYIILNVHLRQRQGKTTPCVCHQSEAAFAWLYLLNTNFSMLICPQCTGVGCVTCRCLITIQRTDFSLKEKLASVKVKRWTERDSECSPNNLYQNVCLSLHILIFQFAESNRRLTLLFVEVCSWQRKYRSYVHIHEEEP